MGKPLGGCGWSNMLSTMPQGPPPALSSPWPQLVDDSRLSHQGPSGFCPIMPVSQGQSWRDPAPKKLPVDCISQACHQVTDMQDDTWDPSCVSEAQGAQAERE